MADLNGSCPLLMAAVIETISPRRLTESSIEEMMKAALCRGTACEWWIQVYTTEGNTVSGCAKAIGPQMNAEGHLAV